MRLSRVMLQSVRIQRQKELSARITIQSFTRMFLERNRVHQIIERNRRIAEEYEFVQTCIPLYHRNAMDKLLLQCVDGAVEDVLVSSRCFNWSVCRRDRNFTYTSIAF